MTECTCQPGAHEFCPSCQLVLRRLMPAPWDGSDESESRLGRLERLGDEYEEQHWNEEKP